MLFCSDLLLKEDKGGPHPSLFQCVNGANCDKMQRESKCSGACFIIAVLWPALSASKPAIKLQKRRGKGNLAKSPALLVFLSMWAWRARLTTAEVHVCYLTIKTRFTDTDMRFIVYPWHTKPMVLSFS